MKKTSHLTLLSRRKILAFSGATTTAVLMSACNNRTPVDKPKSRLIWNIETPMPEPVQEIYPCAHNGRIHQAGGFVAQNGRISGPTSAHYSWTPGEDHWRTETALPTPRHHPHMVSFKDRLLAIAGFESPSAEAVWTIQKTGWLLSADGVSWEPLAPLPAPAAEAVTGITSDGYLRLAGGRSWALGGKTGNWQDHTDTDHHFVLTDLSSSWERAAPCPHKRNSTAGGVIDGRLHIIGGRQVGGGNLDHHTVYDHKEDRWRKLAPMEQAQGGLAAAVVNGRLYAFGGEYFDDGGGVYPECWVYIPNEDRWKGVPHMPSPRHGLGAVALDDKIYVIGGARQASGVDTSDRVEVYWPPE